MLIKRMKKEKQLSYTDNDKVNRRWYYKIK